MYIVQGCGTTVIGCDRAIYIEHGFCAFILNFMFLKVLVFGFCTVSELYDLLCCLFSTV